ncbi:PaaI family thioesterase [Bradyrhizobium sp. ISRA443]|uniref:PaaI family thioesterase n=1 Tax=unclassified Bradyrhizobium TaxID=2631580 RepID=UPI0024791910|nr:MULTISPECIES: PaaI family thioesterase [unclassified Bradyrhizobium]WGR99513.1 PaaI family thioesterase [Bradyrhizobium sp. ISRA436]WGS06403.1 PaaI family thioesterase [Bradyrhizobium sp. ISRA437]WGS13287.1 PaaI family thioesterase [Bradyrhizobium sp. ISRA443]
MTTSPGFDLQRLIATNASAAFNRLIGLEVAASGDGEVELRMPWRDEFTQYAGNLHAGMIAALLDTACGFAAATVVGAVTASHFSMNCLRPAAGRCFVAKGRTVRAGRKQVFARAELFAENDQGEMSLVATGETVLVPLGG